MKLRILLLASALLLINTVNAEDIEFLHLYVFHHCTVLDRELNVINDIPSESGDPMGTFSLVESEGKKYIEVTLAEDPVYEILVVNEVKGKVKKGRRIDLYQGGMQFEGQIVIINVFIEYDTTKNTEYPDVITIDVHNSPNYIQ